MSLLIKKQLHVQGLPLALTVQPEIFVNLTLNKANNNLPMIALMMMQDGRPMMVNFDELNTTTVSVLKSLTDGYLLEVNKALKSDFITKNGWSDSDIEITNL